MTMPRALKITLWFIVSTGAVILLLISMTWWLLMGSHAQLEGTASVQGLENPTTVRRDAQGLVTIDAQSRLDIAFGLGFVHAQERFFQMDLLRRNSAGELSELFGAPAVEFDRDIRRHQFRKRAVAALPVLPDAQRALLDSYTAGVNQGLTSLGAKPFEYYLLQTTPQAWQAADSLLVVYSMYMDLQDEWGETERSLAALNDLLPADWFQFLTPEGGQWDATLDGGDSTYQGQIPSQPLRSFQSDELAALNSHYQDASLPGSNNWSVSGQLTKHGAALVADDMHLGLNVPNIWFRASWVLPESKRRITGATLPGTPVMIVGSTQKIAWGFTNAYGDFSDLIRLQTDAENSQYLTPAGWRAFVIDEEVIRIKGAPSQKVAVKNTQWGPVIGEDHFGNSLAMRWVAHDPEGVNLGLFDLEQAENVEQALVIAAQTAIPGQNFNVGDADGNIGWTLMGRLPNRVGYASQRAKQLPADWSDGKMGWQGFVPAQDFPRITNRDRLWTANARIVSGEALRLVGDGFGALGARQQQIRDRLQAADQFVETDFLKLQLDDEALFLARWQSLLMLILSDNDLTADPIFIDIKRYVEQWQGRAAADSVRYLFVKRFREQVIDQSVGHVLRYVGSKTTDFWSSSIDNKIEYPVWQLITEQPAHQIPAPFQSWDAFLKAQAIQVYLQLTLPDTGLNEQTWGNHNQLAIRHPLSSALPSLAFLLDMEKQPMSGDTYMPRVQSSDFGASQRMAVSPGHEEDGYFHMATGQSGHPLSPFYRAGHQDWVEGKPTPFLPGGDAYVLRLVPQP